MLGDDPPYLSVGTEVSAKYKGAFCEAKIRKVVRSVKCRVTYKQGLGTATVTDEQIKGTLRVGASVEARHNDKKDFVEATITKIQDCSQYTVVFDDGDITTLRRTALCLKSGRHFAESETLDQLPLTHPEHFGNPVIGGRRGRRSRQTQDDSSDEDDDGPRGSNDSGSGSGGKEGPEREPEIGRVVCVELGDKKKKDNWFPGLVVAPTAQDTVRIRVRDDYLVRSFKDARYYTVPKKEATEFTKDLVNKVENSALKVAVEKALLFLEKNELPPHWDKDSLFGNSVSSGDSDSNGELDSDSSDDEPREEKDHFVAQLYKFMDDRGTPINNCPMIGNEDIDLYRLFRAVYKLGGYNRVTNQNQWKLITRRLSFSMQNNSSTHNLVKQAYKKFLHSFEDFYRKLGCTMVNHPRGSIRKQRPGRSLIRDKDRNTPVPTQDKSIVKTEKEDDEKSEKKAIVVEDESKNQKREIKKEPVIKEEEVQPKVKRKEEPAEESASGQESDVNIEGEEESSSSEKSQKSSRLTPSSGVSNKSKAGTGPASKNKEETTKKKNVQEKKKTETKKPDKKEDKIKEEDSTKTRSKSKEDIAKGKPNSVMDVRETRTPSRESDRKVLTKQRKMTDEELKKRGRKKKEVEGEKGKAPDDRSVEYAPSYKGPVELGDRLKVYYGPTHESKVTYEAKVIDMENDGTEAVYLVHYTGWNTRYDEWIKGSRIAQNFTQAQGRMKRTKATPRPQTPSANSAKSSKGTTAPNAGTGAASSASVQSRRRAQGDGPSGASGLSGKDSRKDDRESTPATRSTTPSPLISNILRTKSPATTANNRTTRVTRNAESASAYANDLGRRTRRTSGHADAMVAGESESEESESLESDASVEPETTQMQSRSRVKGSGVQERNRREARRRAESRMKIEETSDVEVEKDVEMEPRRGRRLRKPIGKMQEVKSEPESEEEQPKGRDFDLNQIRSELKGFDKAVKLEITSIEPEPEEEKQPIIPVKQEKIEPENIVDKKVISEPEKKREITKVEQSNITPIKREPVKVEASQAENTEDIYEFKEPEPFEFEVRNKRDSGGSTGSNTDKEKEKEKDKTKKRVFEEDLKSPKKRQKTFNATGPPSATKVETKTETSPTDNIESKKKPRKLFKKNEDPEEAENESEEAPRDISKFYQANYSNVITFKRKGQMANKTRAMDEGFADEPTGAESPESPKKRQPKSFAAAATIKANESKVDSTVTENVDSKKKVRKIFSKKTDEVDENVEGDDSNKEFPKFYPNYSGAKALNADENSLGDAKDKVKKITEEDTLKNLKKGQKPFGAIATKVETNSNDSTDLKKKPARRLVNKKEENTDDSETETDEPTVTRDHTKYFSHYSGPKAKAAAAMANENDSLQDRLAASKMEAQTNESTKLYSLSANASLSHDKDEGKSKSIEPVAIASTSVENKQSTSIDKKRVLDSGLSIKPETKQEPKPLDFTPIVPHTLPVPAPISARLPATASIEEKLSAAAVFRSKMKETKKEEDLEPTPRKTVKETVKKTETLSAKKAKEKEENKVRHEPEKKKQQPEQIMPKKDPLQEIEVRKDPLLEVMKKKDEEMKAKKEAELKATIITTNIPVTKTYGNQKKDQIIKLEETWKKNTAAINEQVSCELVSNDPVKDYIAVRKETIVSKIKSSIDRDSVDSTDSSDSERRLTIIDSEDFPDDKCNESSSDVKIKTVTNTTPGQFNCVMQQDRTTVVSINQTELNHQIGVVNVVGQMIQSKNAKMEEDGENLNSLLCEEEIPGSPTPGSEPMDHEHRATSSQNLVKTDMGSKVAVAFVAAQMPLSTVATPTQITNCAIVTTMSGGVTVSQSTSNLVAVSMTVQHASIQPMRQPQPLPHPQPQQQPQQQQPQVQPQLPPQIQHQQQQLQQHQQQHHHQQQQQPQPQPRQHEQPAPIPIVVQRRESNEAAPVMDNTPPTTPDSNISSISGSPRDERTGGSTPSSSEDNNFKLNRDSSEAENDSGGKGISEDDGSSLVNSEIGGNGANSADRAGLKPPAKRSADNENISPKKRMKKRKDTDNTSTSGQNSSSGKKSPRQSTRNTRHGIGSDSDDTSEGSNLCVNNSTSQLNNATATTGSTAITNIVITGVNNVENTNLSSFTSRSSRPTKYNFVPEFDSNIDTNQRLAILQHNLSELRKTYNAVKVELAGIERRRKKLKRREREAQKAAKAEMQQACAISERR